MIEIYYILSEILFISIFFSLPILFIDKNYYTKSIKINFIDKIPVNGKNQRTDQGNMNTNKKETAQRYNYKMQSINR